MQTVSTHDRLTSSCQARPLVKFFCVAKVNGDGDCFFHALAYFDGYDGQALRIDMADFLEEQALTQPGFKEEWRQEAMKLRGYKWGGHTAMAAYSLMRGQRIVVHTRLAGTGAVKVEELSHASVQGRDEVPMAHILHNGIDHYDALVEVSDTQGLQPAWDQPPPPAYFNFGTSKISEEFPPFGTNLPRQPKRGSGFNAPRPNKKQRPAKETEEHEAQQAEEEEEPVTSLMDDLGNIPLAAISTHPHRQVSLEVYFVAFSSTPICWAPMWDHCGRKDYKELLWV